MLVSVVSKVEVALVSTHLDSSVGEEGIVGGVF